MLARRVRAVIAALWCGGAVLAGAVVAPLAFAMIEERSLAGDLAGTVFRWVGGLSIPFAALYLALLPGPRRGDARTWLAGGAFVCLGIGVFGFGGWLEWLRAAGGSPPGWVHGLASLAYLGGAALLVVLVWRDAGEARR